MKINVTLLPKMQFHFRSAWVSWPAQRRENEQQRILGQLGRLITNSQVKERHLEVVDLVVDALDSDPATPILSAVVEAARADQVGGFVPPSWATLSHGARPPPREPDELEPHRRDAP